MPISRLIASRPEEAGVDSAALEKVFARAQEEVDQGRLGACSVAVARHGRLAGMRTFGTCPDGSKATDETLFCMYSAGKAVTAVAMWQLYEQGKFQLTDPVMKFIPEFGTNGKEKVLMRHLVTFSGGFPNPKGNLMSPEKYGSSAARSAEFAKWELEWEPGTEWAYHAVSAHWVMVECIERISGMDFRDYLRSQVLDPSGLSSLFVGLPEEIQGQYQVADIAVTNLGEKVSPNMQKFVEQMKPGQPINAVNSLAQLVRDPKVRALGVPGGGALGTAADLALLYQPLVNGGKVFGGGQIVKPETIEFATRPLTDKRHNTVFGLIDGPKAVKGYAESKLPLLPKNRGLVMEIAGDDEFTFPADEKSLPKMYQGIGLAGKTVAGRLGRQGQFGASNSARAFGHDGAYGQIGWGDPETGISLGFVTNSLDMGPNGINRMNAWVRGSALADLANKCSAQGAKL